MNICFCGDKKTTDKKSIGKYRKAINHFDELKIEKAFIVSVRVALGVSGY